jgi:hypothetical protein
MNWLRETCHSASLGVLSMVVREMHRSLTWAGLTTPSLHLPVLRPMGLPALTPAVVRPQRGTPR